MSGRPCGPMGTLMPGGLTSRGGVGDVGAVGNGTGTGSATGRSGAGVDDGWPGRGTEAWYPAAWQVRHGAAVESK